MKRIFFTVLSFLLLILSASGQSQYDPAYVTVFRESRDRDFRNPQVSPLRPEDFAGFNGLKYFLIDKSFSVKATFTKASGERSFLMPTSSGRTVKYLKIGVLSFILDGQELTLGAYQREYENPHFKPADDILFVPFRDLTSSKETYGAGRYVYLRIPKEKETMLDFNMAFNPSCAYGNEGFSCTLPPKENFLPVEIKAGEKIYK